MYSVVDEVKRHYAQQDAREIRRFVTDAFEPFRPGEVLIRVQKGIDLDVQIQVIIPVWPWFEFKVVVSPVTQRISSLDQIMEWLAYEITGYINDIPRTEPEPNIILGED